MSMTPTQAKKLGSLIAKARIRKGVSLRTLAADLGVHTSWLGRLEQGDYADPAPSRLARIAEALDISPGRMDRITKGAVTEGLPSMGTYFRAKYDLTADEIERIERYIERLRRQP